MRLHALPMVSSKSIVVRALHFIVVQSPLAAGLIVVGMVLGLWQLGVSLMVPGYEAFAGTLDSSGRISVCSHRDIPQQKPGVEVTWYQQRAEPRRGHVLTSGDDSGCLLIGVAASDLPGAVPLPGTPATVFVEIEVGAERAIDRVRKQFRHQR